MSTVLLVVAALCAVLGSNHVHASVVTIEGLCMNNVPWFDRISDISKLDLQSSLAKSSGCNQHIIKSVEELQKLLALNQNGLICTPQAGEQLADLINNYVLKRGSPMPANVRAFVERLAFKMSEECKKSLLENQGELDAKLNIAQSLLVTKFERSGAMPLDPVEDWSIKEADPFRLAVELLRSIQAVGASVDHEADKLSAGTKQYLYRLREDCVSTLYPLTTSSMSTLIRITQLGYNRNARISDVVTKWLNVMLMCETVRNLKSLAPLGVKLDPYEVKGMPFVLPVTLNDSLTADSRKGSPRDWLEVDGAQARLASYAALSWRKKANKRFAGDQYSPLSELSLSHKRLVLSLLHHIDVHRNANWL